MHFKFFCQRSLDVSIKRISRIILIHIIKKIIIRQEIKDLNEEFYKLNNKIFLYSNI